MVTIQDKITGIEKLIKDFEDLGETYLADRGNARLNELKEQLERENEIRA